VLLKRRALATVCGALLLCAWPVVTHLAVVNARIDIASLLLASVVPVVIASMIGVRRWAALASGMLGAAVLAYARPEWLLYASPVAINLLLAWLFGRTLGLGCTPMISRFAELEQNTLTEELALYTRRLTWTWTVFFILMAAISATLAVAAPLGAWSVFTNMINYALVAILFLGEFV
jgi:uncharacterized membrane protein